MKIISFGDLHFGAGYDDDVCASLVQIIELARGCDLILVTGDVYERASSPNDRKLAVSNMIQLSEIAPVIVVKGNHDAPQDLAIFGSIRARNPISVFESPGWIDTGKTLIHCMPWFTKAHWLRNNPGLSIEDSDKTVGKLALDSLRGQVEMHPDKKHIFLGHILINGAKAQNHQPLIGEGITFGQYDLREIGFYAGIFGHIHLKQQFDDGRFFYPGSIAPMNYGETPDKYVSIFDTESGEVYFEKLATVHRCDIDAESVSPTEYSHNANRSEISGSRVRVNFRLKEGDDIDMFKRKIQEWLEGLGAIEIKINIQTVPQSQLRAEQISKATSLKKKLTVYWDTTQRPDDITQKDMLNKLDDLEEECNLSTL